MRPLTGLTYFCVVRKTILLNCLPLAFDIYKNPGNLPTATEKKFFLTFFKFPHEKMISYVRSGEKCGRITLIGLALTGYPMFTKRFERVRSAVLMTAWQHIIRLSWAMCSLRRIFSLSEWPTCCLFIISISYQNQNWKKENSETQASHLWPE